MNRAEKNRAQVKAARKKLKEKTWKCMPIQQKDIKKNTAMDVYAVFLRVYDAKNQIVPNFFVCRICKLLEFVNLSKDGNSFETSRMFKRTVRS